VSADVLTKQKDVGARQRYWWLYGVVVLIALVGMIAAERVMGRIWISQSGQVKLWVSETNGAETSQQIFDWYTVTHVEHGLVLYGIAWLVCRKMIGVRESAAWTWWSFMWVLLAEAGWEVLENSPIIIDRYRAQTMAVGYAGDTILNSVMDVASCMLGWWIARRLPWWGTLGVLVVVEVFLLFAIRDNLTLNGIMLFWPIEVIKQWQQG
jgi:hypothetical protein